jgi:hypothetical protein
MRKSRQSKKRRSAAPSPARARRVATAPADRNSFVAQPVLRQLFGNPSPVTWWRWRHDPKLDMPPLKEINGRLYGQWGAFSDWLAKRPNAANKLAEAA